MQWLNDNAALVLVGLVLFTAVWVIAFFIRNSAAKGDKNLRTNDTAQTDGSISIQKAPIRKSTK